MFEGLVEVVLKVLEDDVSFGFDFGDDLGDVGDVFVIIFFY